MRKQLQTLCLVSTVLVTGVLSSCSSRTYDFVRVKQDKVNNNQPDVVLVANVEQEAVVSSQIITPAYTQQAESTNEVINDQQPVQALPVSASNSMTENAPLVNQSSGRTVASTNYAAEAGSTTTKLTLERKPSVKQMDRLKKFAKKAPIKKGGYLWIGIVLLLIGLVVGLVFGGLGYLISVIGLVFLVLGLLTEVL